MNADVGFVTQTGMSYREALPRAGEWDLDYVELIMDGVNERTRLDADRDAVIGLAAEHALGLNVHLPFRLDPAAPYDHVREGSVRELRAAIETASDVGASKAVMHAGTQSWRPAWDDETLHDLLLESVREIDDHAAAHGVELCVENLNTGFFTLRDDFPRLLAETRANVCLDTGHATVEGYAPGEIGRFVADNLERVSHVHLADPRSDGAAHMPFGAGRIDFAALFAPMVEAGWSGTLSLEVFAGYDYVETSVERLRELL